LQISLRTWLKSIAQELLARLQNTCGTFPCWAEQLLSPRKSAKRNFCIIDISITIDPFSMPSSNRGSFQRDSDLPDLEWTTAQSTDVLSSTQSTPDSKAHETGQQSQAAHRSQLTPKYQVVRSQSPAGYTLNAGHAVSTSYDAVVTSPSRNMLSLTIEDNHSGNYSDHDWRSIVYHGDDAIKQANASQQNDYHYTPTDQIFASMYLSLPSSSTFEVIFYVK